VPPEMAMGALTGLKAAFASILQVPVSCIDSALRARSSFIDSELNSRIESGVDVQRNRSDWYNRLIPYNYFHHLGDMRDYCMLVEPDKSQRKAWKGKTWDLGGQPMILRCQPHLRRASIETLIKDYRDSESCRT
jgi:hypothetical protein